MVKLVCPSCGKGYRIVTSKKQVSRCGLCGYEGKTEEFKKPFKEVIE